MGSDTFHWFGMWDFDWLSHSQITLTEVVRLWASCERGAMIKYYCDCMCLQSEDFFSLIENHEGKPLKLLVYNTETDGCREVVVTPNGAWGGEGR